MVKGIGLHFLTSLKNSRKVINGVPVQPRISCVYALEGPPSEYYAVLEEQDPHITYKEIVSKLANRYGRKDLDENMKEKFRGMKQETGRGSR